MFYEAELPEPKPGRKKIAALVVLNPAESRRLLAKATVATPEVQKARKNGTIIIGRGITNAYVTEELLGITIEPKAGQAYGLICNGITNATPNPPPCTCHVIRKGKVVENADSNVEILSFGPEDVFIKGGNAIDPQGNAGIFAANGKGGTIGMCWPVVTPRGAHLLMPIGLEKLIPSVLEAFKHTGIYYFKYSTGIPARIMPVQTGLVITEIQALAILAGVKAYHVASGGVGGSEGAVTLTLEGDEERLTKAFEIVKAIKGEKPPALPSKFFVSSAGDYNYDALAQHGTLPK
jgi:hypothetical protein